MKLSTGGKEVTDRVVVGGWGQRWANVEVLPGLREKMFDPFQTLKEPRELGERLFLGGRGIAQITLSQKKNSPSVRMKQVVMVLPSLKSFHKYASSFLQKRACRDNSSSFQPG